MSDTPTDGVVRLMIDAPARNALSSALVDELSGALARAAASQPSVVALCAAGPAFCGGFHLGEPLDDRAAGRRFAAIQALLEQLRRAPFVTVACVRGPAYGAGADLVAACDYRLATRTARFRFPGSRFGLVLGLRRLSAVVGADAARDLALRAAPIDAHEAHRLGLVTHLLDDDALPAFVDRLAEQIADLDAETRTAILEVTRLAAAPTDAELVLRTAHRDGIAERITGYAQRIADARAAARADGPAGPADGGGR